MSAVFDMDALHAALDDKRRSSGKTWAQVAREVGGVVPGSGKSGISASTLSGLHRRRAVEGDGVLQMLRWLGRSPESFLVVGGRRIASTFDRQGTVSSGGSRREEMPALAVSW